MDPSESSFVTLFLCGDVMTGRGIDQALPFSSDPAMHESYVRDARDYVALAEKKNGPFHRPVSFRYIWGDALEELSRASVDVRIINLETSITSSDDYWDGKAIHYRMHPRNIGCLTAANINACSLANNHVMDWGYGGLLETLQTLDAAGILHSGAGRNQAEAEAPAVLEVRGAHQAGLGNDQIGKDDGIRNNVSLASKAKRGGEGPRERRFMGKSSLENSRSPDLVTLIGRVLLFAYASTTSGVPEEWAATQGRCGVNLLDDLSKDTAEQIAFRMRQIKRSTDIAIASIHWGGNWGYNIPAEQTVFARRLIDEGFDIIHGHSSHHVKSIELYENKLILYGCGDLVTDYEGIGGYEHFRGELSLLYLPRVDLRNGHLVELRMVPMQLRQFQLHRASEENTKWLCDLLNNSGKPFRTRFEIARNTSIRLLPS